MLETRLSDARPQSELHESRRCDFRNPPLFWRRVFVGIALAMPGTIAGLTIAMLIPAASAPYSAWIGAMVGFFSGYQLERR
jgi:hypothetical protein